MTRIALISDIHMREGHSAAVAEELERLVEVLDDSAPERVFVMGDLIEDGPSEATDEENVGKVRSILEGVSAPVTYLLGNHDVENLSRESLSDLLDQESFHGVVEVGDVPVVYLDSTWERVAGARGLLGEAQLDWLAEVLPDLSGALVLVHHPLGHFDLSRNEWFREYPERAFLGDRMEALRILERCDVRATISGHIHETHFSEFHDLPHVSVNAFSKETREKPLTGTFADVRLDEAVEVEIKTRTASGVSFQF